MTLLDDLLARISGVDEASRKKLVSDVVAATAHRLWVPNPGPQTDAVFCEADELFYGGEAGGGKTDLACGLALTDHSRSLLLRRTDSDTLGIEERLVEIVGNSSGLDRQKHVWRRPDGRVIKIGGCQYEDDKQKYKGRPNDLIVFDEITDFTESQFRFIKGWNRSTREGQRCRVIATGNPPTTAEGLWVIQYWAAWLDPAHPRPAKSGELRWYTTAGGRDIDCASGDPIVVDGETVKPRSRTFIRARLSDNPDLAATDYGSVLAALPEELRRAYRDGVFVSGFRDADFQVIPTEWVRAAQARWTEICPGPMSCLGHDVALGGGDANTRARRHGHWFAPVLSERLAGFVDPLDLAAGTIKVMRDGCPIVIDMGGGYGSGVYSHLKSNVAGLKLFGFNGSETSTRRTRDGKLGFANKRAEVWWKFREALEPNLGEPIALPPDQELLADLTAPTWKLGRNGITVEPKVDIKARLGRSPDKADAVVMAWAFGETAATERAIRINTGGLPKVNVGYANMKGRR